MFYQSLRLFFACFLLVILVIPSSNVSAQVVAERTMPSDIYTPGLDFRVTIWVKGDPVAVTVVETPPPGWTIDRIMGGGQVTQGTLTWELASFTGSQKISYMVTPPSDAAGDAVFSGQVGDVEIAGMNTLRNPLPFRLGTLINLGPIVNTRYAEAGPCISADGLELFFTSNRPDGTGGYDLWVATRVSATDDWNAPANLGSGVNSSAADYASTITTDGLTLFFNSTRPGGYGLDDIWMTTRETKSDPWSPPVNLGQPVNSNSYDWTPSISADGLSLYFGSTRGGGYAELYMTSRAGKDSGWTSPVLVPNVNSQLHTDLYPSISADGLTLFWGSWESGGFGSADLYGSTRKTLDDTWSKPMNLGSAVNTSTTDGYPNLSSGGHTLYFSDEPDTTYCPPRPGGYGSADLWQVSVEWLLPSTVETWSLYQ